MGDAEIRRRIAALAGHSGDEAAARRALADPSPAVRATALGALARIGGLTTAEVRAALADRAAPVRRRACEVAAALAGPVGPEHVEPLLADPDPSVVEAAAWALGERGSQADPAVPTLAEVATGHDEALCREAAVAALGAIGHPDGLPAVLAATTDRPAVRRRAVLALAPFAGAEVEAALSRALEDRDWQVRQAAEDLLSDR